MLKFLRQGANAFGVALFALLFIVFVVKVVARFAFGKPLAWTDEAAVILYLWAILWGAAVVCKDRGNVAFDLLYQSAAPGVRRAMALLGCALVGVLAAWGLPGRWTTSTSCAANLPLCWGCHCTLCMRRLRFC